MRFALWFVALACCVACSKDVEFRLDNPTSHELSVALDGTTYAIAGGSDAAVRLAPGRHALDSEATGSVHFIVFANGKGGLINPTRTDYVTVNEVYATDQKARRGFAPVSNVEGVRLRGPFSASRALFIDRTWQYGVHEDFPSTITVSSSSKGNIQGKVFAIEDFVRYHSANGGREFIDQTRTPTPPTPSSTELEPLPDFVDAEMQAASAELREIYAAYPRAETRETQKALSERYQAGVTKLLAVYGAKAMSLGPIEAQKYNDLITNVGGLLGRSALVVD